MSLEHADPDNSTAEDSTALEAILVGPQLERLCDEFGLTPGELEPDFTGWSKHVIKSPDHVFLFPRHPKYQQSLNIELELYKLLNELDQLPVPRLVRAVENRELSPYRFGVVTRLQGILLGNIEHGLGASDYEEMLCTIGRLAAIWHNLQMGHETDFLKPLSQDVDGDHGDSYRWMYGALRSGSPGEAPDLIASSVRELAAGGGTEDFSELNSVSTTGKWRRALSELSMMDDVLLHGDIHEDQILVRSERDLEVTGILDWGNAGVGNPALEFNFGEWGAEIWRYRETFGKFREAIWRKYMHARGLDGPSWEALHILYTLQELIWTMTARKPIGNEGGSYESEMRRLLRTLKETTARL